MGKNYTIYFHDDVDELIGQVDGKGTLINNLIRQHFSHDEETLRRKITIMNRELDILKVKLESKREERLQKEGATAEIKEERMNRKKKHDIAKKKIIQQAENKEITFDEFRLASIQLKKKYNL